ncbi:MAG: deoxyribose-phosphate aldolase [Clostridia bacterium]|nr:deoxyribose-phosphate aldolase [Clostridia bacterium]
MFFKNQNKFSSDGLGDLASMIDFAMLDSRATEKDIISSCNIAYKNRYHGIEVFPCYVKTCKEYISRKLDDAVSVVCVIDFPFGTATMQDKIHQVKTAFADGADEVDVCINTGDIIDENYKEIRGLLLRVCRLAKHKIVKAVIEASYLDREQVNKLCRVLLKTKIDFVMANTGFGQSGVTPEDVEQLKIALKDKIAVKASGGIATKADANNMIRMGATRIGTSRVL